VRLAGPFGAGALQLRFDGEELRLTGSRGETLRGEEATTALRRQLGFDPPLAALRYWLLAQPAPSAEPAASIQPGAGVGATGAPASLTQHDWQLSYEDYRAESLQQGQVQLPRRITATREAVRLRLVVDRWRLGARH
jgi:outer membrane lipoprotein LolB